ncbi:MAG: copper resistance protein CopC/CopD [Chloroflexi bacterium]|uniref:CopD family protein n=1 Tax=Candidatus Chlorohelix allophototropha TaxID=3003348 RepID=A0A8T7M282_9CHLR|nr:copper resistance protein CopC/CopD [Chloroflexota bacterium]WJW67891.1 CopD family protein [Chloroflexota bacterium L227-S17]
MSKQQIRAISALLAFSFALFFGNMASASAHAILIRTDPQDGANLAETPKQAHLWFNDLIIMDFTSVELVNDEGQHLPAKALRLNTEMTAAAVKEYDNPKIMVLEVDLPELTPHAYRLDWKSRSADDLHTITGTVIFGVQHSIAPETRKVTETTPPPLEVFMRWLSFGGISGLAGAFTLSLTILPKARKKLEQEGEFAIPVRARLMKLAGWSGLLAFVAGLGLLLVQGFAGEGGVDGWWVIISRTAYGLRWLISQSLLLILAVLFLKAVKPEKFSQSVVRVAVIALTLALLVVEALNGHAPAEGVSGLSLSIDVIHLLSSGMWVGGLFALVVAVVPLLHKNQAGRATAIAMLKRFSGVAAVSLIAVIASGLYKSGKQVASIDALLVTLYGQALMLKVYLVLFMALLGLVNTAVLHPRVGAFLGKLLRKPQDWKPTSSRLLRRTILVEAGVATLVLLLAALIGTSQPARGPEFEPLFTGEASSSLTANANDLIFNLSIKPNRPGQNFISIGIFNSRRPAPAPIESVAVKLDSPGQQGSGITVNAESLGNGRYQIAGGYLNKAGIWNLALVVNRPGMEETKLSVPWTVAAGEDASEKRPVIVSNQSIGSLLDWAAALVALLAFTGLGGWRLSKKLSWNFNSFLLFKTLRQTRSERRE